MKRFIILLFVFMFFPSFVDADECSYKEKRELATLASYVDYTYKYNEDKETFDITIMNINDKIEIFYENQKNGKRNGFTCCSDLCICGCVIDLQSR